MGPLATIRQRVSYSVTLLCMAAAWAACGTQPTGPTTTSTSSSSTSAGGSGGNGGTGGTDVAIDAGPGEDSGSCTSTSAVAKHVQLDLVFVIDQSLSMAGTKWLGATTALKTFFSDPASAGLGAGIVFFPNNQASTCNPDDYKALDVPIDVLPANVFPLVNSMPADATGNSTPTWGALNGALMAATAYQDSHPTHKVVVLLVTDGDPNSCAMFTIDDIAGLAKSARNYNGVETYVIGVPGSIIANLDKVAVAGGTNAAYDVTHDINLLFENLTAIRGTALGCEFEIPPPPNGQQLDPDFVNFTYTPKGTGAPKTLLRADDLIDCQGKPGWYYDNNANPTKIVLCPATCATVKSDGSAKVNALFGCKSLIN